ncbi:MAG TPA: phosphatidylserine decarboxylase, partial [Methylotenera sp.]|nr:phosphatidylserine decarboxylase [Methylotenera sp.]
IVGSMATVWHQENTGALNGIINPPRTGQIRSWNYENITLKQGDEMGRFLLGSTVVMLFEKDTLQFNAAWQPALAIKLGGMMSVK